MCDGKIKNFTNFLNFSNQFIEHGNWIMIGWKRRNMHRWLRKEQTGKLILSEEYREDPPARCGEIVDTFSSSANNNTKSHIATCTHLVNPLPGEGKSKIHTHTNYHTHHMWITPTDTPTHSRTHTYKDTQRPELPTILVFAGTVFCDFMIYLWLFQFVV